MAVALSWDCKELGLSLRGLNSVVRAVAMLIGGTIQAVVVISDCKDLSSGNRSMQTLSSKREFHSSATEDVSKAF